MSEREPAASWAYLLERLAAAGRLVEEHAVDDRERAEGYRHVTRVLSIAHEMLMEKGDTARPQLTRWMRSWRKMMGDNPHTLYDAALLDAERTYVLRGRQGETAYFGVTLYGTSPEGARRIAANADDSAEHEVNLQTGTAADGHTRITYAPDDGSFEIWIAHEEPAELPDGAVWLPMPPDVTDLLIRQYFREASTFDGGQLREATLALEAAAVPGPPPPVDPEQIGQRLRRVADYVHDLVEVEAAISSVSAMTAPASVRAAHDSGAQAEVNWDAVSRVQPTPGVQYHGAWFSDLADEEAVVIEGTLRPCRYASVQLLTRWMESGDWLHHPVFVTEDELELDEERRFRLVVAHRDPGTRPWLATTGLRNATAVVRTIGADSESELTFERVAFDKLSER